MPNVHVGQKSEWKSVQDHSFNLIENLHHRLSRQDEQLGLPLDETEAFSVFLDKMKQHES